MTELARLRRQDLHKCAVFLHPDRTNAILGDATRLTNLGQQPPCLGPTRPPNRQLEPDRRPELAPFTRRRPFRHHQIVRQNLGRRPPVTPHLDKGSGNLLRPITLQQVGGQIALVADIRVQHRVIQQTQIVPLLHLIRRWRLVPCRNQLGPLQQALRLLELGRHHDQRRHTLFPRPARAARAVKQGFRIRRQIGVDHQIQARQVNAPRRHIRRDTDPRPTVPQRLQGMGPLGLRQLTRQRNGLKTAVVHAGEQMADIGAGLAEHQGRLAFIEPQQVEDRMLPVARRHRKGAVFDVDMLPRLALGLDPQRIALEILGKGRDFLGNRRREHQRPALGRGHAQNELQILAKAQIQHLIRLVQHNGADARHVQR